ncbi:MULTISPECIES: hypothetical protein [Paenibacillus]|uniref:Uncharacterized protein n=1 Tax=Paenibacillus odorifer TaxID=189426 RepID=A0A1R0X1H6_9BACL|nr:hypothetical protein [Paenibacillus odorifer]OMD26751.1 hypothetical protein BJP51_26535 [Paenibacillus odorifer]OME30618.1 hypothetical protein BSK63_17140 [Paenibacillus odorifer]
MSTSIFIEKPVQQIHPSLINRMKRILEEVVIHSKFHCDFYKKDLKAMEQCSKFAWFVYDCGTHFIPLTEDAIHSFENEWICSIDDLKPNNLAKSTDRLYVCNTRTGNMTRIHSYKNGNLLSKLSPSS